MPEAREVPFWGARRSIAAITEPWSLVGVWIETPESLKATTPIVTLDGWRATKSSAAALAASIRVGARSVAAMLAETSKARMTVPSCLGRATTAWGLARATDMTTSPQRKSAGGTRFRRRISRPALPGAGPGPP